MYIPESSKHISVNPAPSNSFDIGGHLFIALSLIFLLGTLISTGFLYSRLGPSALGIAGGGVLLAIICLSLRYYYRGTHIEEAGDEEKEGAKLIPKTAVQRTEDIETPINPPRTQELVTPLTAQPNNQVKTPPHFTPLSDQSLVPKPGAAPTAHIIPPDWDIRESRWIYNGQIHPYLRYLVANHYPRVNISVTAHGFPINCLKGHIKSLNKSTDDYKKVNYPFCLQVSENHWTLVYVNRSDRKIEYYDSKVNYGEFREIQKELKSIADDLSQEDPSGPAFEVIFKIHKILQPDSHQCGIWVPYFLDKILNDPPFDFNKLKNPEKVIAEYRIEVMNRLIQLDALEKAVDAEESQAYQNQFGPKKGSKKLNKARKSIHHLVRLSEHLKGNRLAAFLTPPEAT